MLAGMDCPRVRYPTFNDAVEAGLGAASYQVLTAAGEQVDKVVQLYEVLMTRHTVMVVGQTGGGKSVILNTLAQAQTAMGRRTTLHVLNPKAITVSELYGVLDKDTRDWTDGLLSNMFRYAVKEAPLPPCVLPPHPPLSTPPSSMSQQLRTLLHSHVCATNGLGLQFRKQAAAALAPGYGAP